MRNEITLHGGEFIATGDIIADAVGGKWDNPSGAFNVALKDNLTKLSVADEWKEARKEWKATGNIWYVPMRDDATEILPEPHKSSHAHYCICGHPIAWHFEIENTENGRIEIVGSEHIGFWMIVRHLIENLKIPEDMITQERVKEWIQEAVKSMKAEWWWKHNGEQFEEWFTAKKSNGNYGTPEYNMASIVWRWNHPDNTTTAQINSRGWPNDRLWNDLMMFYFNLDKHNNTITEMHTEREQRINTVAEERRQEEERRLRQQTEYEERRRIRDEEQRVIQNEEQILKDTAFERTCGDWGIMEFVAEDGRNDWEISFLTDMIKRINNMSHISVKQKNRVIKIINRDDEEATEKQLSYIRKLGGEPTPTITKKEASNLIDELKNPSIPEEMNK